MSEKNSIEILKKLVSFDTTSFKSNLDLIKFIENYLNDLNIKSELIYDKTKNKANLFTTIGPNLQGGIVLSGHTDVVPITKQNWTSDPFILTERDNKLFGRGSSDMKGFIAIVLSRVSTMVEKKLKKPIHLAFSYDEEIGCVGVHSLLDLIKKKSINPEFCIVGEPTSMEMVIGHKGKHAYDVKVDGLSCHSGQAPYGVNAINYASKLINYIEESLNGLRGIVTDTITGQPISARVEIFGHDYDSSHVYSNLPVGNYHRYLSPGNYLVNFSAQGYESKSINVDIYSATPTVLNVQLGESNWVGISDLNREKKLIKKVDLLGREGSENSLQIKIYDDGSTLKTFNNKNK